MRMASPAHPGEIIAETLEDMHVSLRQFAKAMDIAPSTASRLLSGQTKDRPQPFAQTGTSLILQSPWHAISSFAPYAPPTSKHLNML